MIFQSKLEQVTVFVLTSLLIVVGHRWLFFFQNNRTSCVELLMFHQKFLKKYLFSNFKILGNCYRSDSERATLFFVENFLQSTPDVKYKGLGLRSVLPPGM